MIRTNYSRPTTSLTASISSRYHYTPYRPKSKYYFLRPRWRWRPNSLSTPILILRPPRSVHLNSSRVWNYFTCSYLLLWEKRTLRIYRYGMSHNIYWLPRIYCMSTSHIHSRPRCRHPSLLYICHYNYRNSYRRKSIQLTRYTTWRKYQMIPRHIMSLRVYLLIHSRGPNRDRTI